MDREKMLALAERCEKATTDLWLLSQEVGRACGMEERYEHPGSQNTAHRPYCTSLDAALTLVPEGWSWSLYDIIGKPETVRMWDGGADLNGRDVLCAAATPALALTAACLRSHAEGTPNVG